MKRNKIYILVAILAIILLIIPACGLDHTDFINWARDKGKTDNKDTDSSAGSEASSEEDKEKAKEEEPLDSQTMGGIGIIITQDEEGRVIIEKVLPGYSAEKEGIQEGDQIIEVDGVEIKDMDIDSVVNIIMGPEGTDVDIKLDSGKVTCTRQKLPLEEDILEEVATLIEPIVLGGLSPGKEVYRGPVVIGDSASNDLVWGWWAYDFSWLSEVWLPEARVDNVSITLTLTDKFGNPLFFNDEPVNIALVDSDTSKIEPLIILIMPTSRIVSDDVSPEDKTADEEAVLKAAISKIEPLIVLITRTRRVTDDTSSYSETIPEDWNLVPYDESLEENAADDEVKVEDLLNEGEITFTGDYLINKINWYLDNELSTVILVFPFPEESDDNNQMDQILLDEKFEIEYSIPKSLEHYYFPTLQPIGGIGLVLTTDSYGNIIVDMVLDGFPAANAGIQKGYQLLKVGAVEVKGMPLNNVVNLVIGPEGTELDVTFVDPGTSEEKKVSLERKVLPPEEDVLIDEPPEEEQTEEPPPEEEKEVLICPDCGKPVDECICD